MDADRFEALLRSFAGSPSRRGLARFLGGVALGGPLAWLDLAEAEARRKKGKKKKRKKKTKKRSGYTPPPAELCPEAAFRECKAPAWELALQQAEVCRSDCETDPGGDTCQACVRPFAEDAAAASRTCAAEVCRGGPADAGSTNGVEQAPRSSRLQAAATAACNATELGRCIDDLVFADILCTGVTLATCLETLGLGCAAAIAACEANWRYTYGACIERNGCPGGGYCTQDVCCPHVDDTVCNGTCCTGTCCNGKCCDRYHECCNGGCWYKDLGPWTPCGDRCCDASGACCNGVCYQAEAGPWTPCGDRCCAGGYECCNGWCWEKADGPHTPCGSECCRAGWTCCDDTTCCSSSQTCCEGNCTLVECRA